MQNMSVSIPKPSHGHLRWLSLSPGLFTPNAGQHFRDEQRRRRSQYDRGTRLAALEEYDYEAAFQATHVGH